jgi:hypothetical protein
MQHSEEFANSTITELSSTGTDATTSNVMPNFLSSKAGISAIFNPLTITASAAANVPLTIKGAGYQSASLQEWKDSAGSVLVSIGSAGFGLFGANVQINGDLRAGSSNLARITSISNSATKIGLVVQGAASQTANLQEWQNSAGTVLGYVKDNGFSASIAGLSYIYTYGIQGWNGGGGNIAFANATPITITPQSASVQSLVVKGAASQTANLQEWQNSSAAILAKIDALGNFTATSKSFDIEHPTKENMRLRYGSLEGPENGVYIRGTAESSIIELPDYWTGLVHEDSITVSLTSVGSAQNIYVEKIENNKVYIGGNLEKAFFTVYGERKDIDKPTVEY